MLAVFDEMQNDDIVAIASADTDYLTLIEFLKAKGKTVLGFAQYQPSLSPLFLKRVLWHVIRRQERLCVHCASGNAR